MKKTSTFLMAMLLVISLVLTSCQNGGTEVGTGGDSNYDIGDTGGLVLPFTDNNEEIKIVGTTDVSDINNKIVIQRLREITGLNIQIEAFPVGSSSDKLSTLIAAKKLPDIMGQLLSDEMALDLAMQGALAPVNDYLEELPNIRSIYSDNKENSWVFKSYAAPDGKLYGVPGYDWNRDVNHGMLYRKDITDKLGIKMWNSPDEFYMALKKMKEAYPESSPYVSKVQKNIFARWSTSWGMAAEKPYYDEKEKVWRFTDTDPKYKEMLDFMRKLYDEKLLDAEFLTMTEASWTAKMTKEDQAFVTNDWIGRLDQFVQIASPTVPEYDLRYGNPAGPKQTIQTLDKISWNKYVANSSKSLLAFKMLDFLLSPAGAQMISMGIEGETYDLVDGKAKYIGFPEGAKIEIKDLENKYGMYLEGMYMRFDRRSNYFQFTEREQEAQDFAKNPDKMEPIDPILPYTQEEKAEINEINLALKKACAEFSTKYIISAETGDVAWNAWLNQANDLGSDRLVEIYNQAQKRFDESR